MTTRAIGAVFAAVTIIIGMAGKTGGRGALEDTIDMTASTGGAGVFAGQHESGSIVIEGGRLPTRGGMTGRAFRSKCTLMEIIRDMTRITIRGCTLELHIGVTLRTDNADVLAGQLEDGIVVIEVTGLPAAGCVAVCALIS